MDYDVFDLGSVALTGGLTLPDAELAYKTYGELNADKSNAIVYPTWYSGRHWDNEWLIGEGAAWTRPVLHHRANMLGNGLSSSPSNTPRRTTGRASPTSPSGTTCPSSTGS